MPTLPDPSKLFTDDAAAVSVPVWLMGRDDDVAGMAGATDAQRRFVSAAGFTGGATRQLVLPDADGGIGGVVLGIGEGTGVPCGPAGLLVGQLAASLPAGTYHLADPLGDGEIAAVAWGLGAYRFQRYKSAPSQPGAVLKLPAGVDLGRVVDAVTGIWLGRDLINTPSEDLGPAELETTARTLAEAHGAAIRVVVGDDLLAENFPLIHAVGRASTRPPRLIDITWGREEARKVTLVGKGICFDTGGLDIKPAAAMLLMKKDMGGAAVALALAHMIMARGLDIRLRVLVAAAENSIAGNAFRPGDVFKSRAGITVEIGNTDAEGRLVLADALALADAEAPDTMMSFATLTGAARVALGADLPAFFTNDDAFAATFVPASEAVGDPVWRLPLWPGYDRQLDSDVADVSHISEGPFGGAITAALFLNRFVQNTRRFAHFDLYAWRQAQRPLGPKGGEPQVARALLHAIEAETRQRGIA